MERNYNCEHGNLSLHRLHTLLLCGGVWLILFFVSFFYEFADEQYLTFCAPDNNDTLPLMSESSSVSNISFSTEEKTFCRSKQMSCKNILFVQDYEVFGGPQKMSWPKNPSFVSSPISRGMRRLETRHPLPATAILECTTHCITTSLTPSSSSAKATHLHAGA